MTIEWIKKHNIREYTNDAEIPSQELPIFDAVVYEVRVRTKLYA